MEAQNQYRAWHKVRKEMYNVHGWHSEYVFKDTLDGVGCDGNPDRLEDVILMQCIGVFDKNGKFIFDGDILFKEGNPGITKKEYLKRLYQVKFDSGHCKFIGQIIGEPKSENIFWPYAHLDYEVVGNVHQNIEWI